MREKDGQVGEVDVGVVVEVAVGVGDAGGRAVVGQERGEVGQVDIAVEVQVRHPPAEDDGALTEVGAGPRIARVLFAQNQVVDAVVVDVTGTVGGVTGVTGDMAQMWITQSATGATTPVT